MPSPNVSPDAVDRHDMNEQEFVFGLDMSDRDILTTFREEFTLSERFWKDKLRTKGDTRAETVRELGEKAFRGDYYNLGELYEHQIPYVDNRIFVSVDTDIPRLTSKVPEPVAKSQLRSEAGKRYAQRFQQVLEDGWVRWGIQSEIRTSLLHLFIAKRVAVMKGRFDPDKGPHGDIVWEAVMPENVVISKYAKPGQNPPFIGEWVAMTLEQIIRDFGHREEVLHKYGYKRGTQKQLTRRVSVLELHFTYWNKTTNKPDEGVVHILDWDIVLGKMRCPNWIYPDENLQRENHLEVPEKPYKIISFRNLNFGRHVLDDSSYLEQAIPQQDILNKRGRQIVEVGDQASGGIVYNTQAISPEEIEELTGDPTERVGVNGDVRGAAMRLPPAQMAAWVFQDKIDARNEVDNIFATQAPVRGEPGANDTLGQDILQSQRSTERLESMAFNIAEAARHIYNFSLQLLKVHADPYHFRRVLGPIGEMDFKQFTADTAEDGLEVTVEPGSLLPTDKFSKRQEAMEMWNAKALDILTFYEEMGVPNPLERAKRYFAFNSQNPMSVLDADIEQDDEQVQEAFDNILSGQQPSAPIAPSERTVATLNRILENPQAKNLSREQIQALRQYAQGVMATVETSPQNVEPGAPITQPQPRARIPA